MKTAVSIPDEIFERAERLARRTNRSRSRLYGEALKEYVERHSPDEITEAMNRVCAQIPEANDPFVAAASARAVKRSEW